MIFRRETYLVVLIDFMLCPPPLVGDQDQLVRFLVLFFLECFVGICSPLLPLFFFSFQGTWFDMCCTSSIRSSASKAGSKSRIQGDLSWYWTPFSFFRLLQSLFTVPAFVIALCCQFHPLSYFYHSVYIFFSFTSKRRRNLPPSQRNQLLLRATCRPAQLALESLLLKGANESSCRCHWFPILRSFFTFFFSILLSLPPSLFFLDHIPFFRRFVRD